MRCLLLIAAAAIGSMPGDAHAQAAQTAWSFTVPVQVSNALTRSVNVTCIVYNQTSAGAEVRFGSGSVTVPLNESGSASTTVTVNVPNSNGNPYDATDYLCRLSLMNLNGEECLPSIGPPGKTDICYAKEGTEYVGVVKGKVK
jgi:hypothetical protein